MSSPFAKGFSQQAHRDENPFMGFDTSGEPESYQQTPNASDDVIEGEFKEKK